VSSFVSLRIPAKEIMGNSEKIAAKAVIAKFILWKASDDSILKRDISGFYQIDSG
jgi:hypothetical protein